MLTKEEVQAFAVDIESDRVERTVSTTDTEKFREAICAFSNDLPRNGAPGYLLIGVTDAGAITGAAVTDQLLQSLAAKRDDGGIQPMPSMNVAKVDMGAGVAVAVVEVFPSDAPPVRARGRVWVRVGPRRALASDQEERRLTEKRVHGARTFDQQPCPGASLSDLIIPEFEQNYLPTVVAADVLAANARTLPERLASLRFLDPRSNQPTNGAVLLFGVDPLGYLPGAYVQLVRFDGTDMAAPMIDSRRIAGNLVTQLRALDGLLPLQIRTARVPAGGLRFDDAPDYPVVAIRELVLNAVMHRTYDGTSAPVRISWFEDRVEIQNPGGLYGHATPLNFDRMPDYRNPLLAEAMSALGYVDKFGTGVARARQALVANGNPPPEFAFEPTHSLVTVRRRP